jgi:NRPS condensation-like uncharacterized protein
MQVHIMLQHSVLNAISRRSYLRSLKVLRVTLHEQSNDQAEQAENGSKDLDSENLDESERVNEGT